MNTIFNATNALNTMSTSAGEIGVYVLALFGLLAGLHLAIAWFKRGVRGAAAGKVK